MIGTSRTKNAKAQEFLRRQGHQDGRPTTTPCWRTRAVEAVVLATPHSQHGDQTRKAAAAGKHVFIEKPFTLTAADAKSAIDAIKKAGKVLAVGFNRRFHPNMIELRARVQDGRLGTSGQRHRRADRLCGLREGGTAGYLARHRRGGPRRRHDRHRRPHARQHDRPVRQGDDVHCIATRRSAPHVDDTNMRAAASSPTAPPARSSAAFATAPSYRFAAYGSNGLAEILKPTLEEVPLPARFRRSRASRRASRKRSRSRDSTPSRPNWPRSPRRPRAASPYPVPLDEVLHGVEAFEAIVRSSKEGKPVKVG